MIEWFDGRVASESRLWDALDQGLLRPFHDFGVNDPTNLAAVKFQRGRDVAGHLDDVFTSDFFGIFADRIRTVSEPLDLYGEVPVAIHATYSLGEIVAASRIREAANPKEPESTNKEISEDS